MGLEKEEEWKRRPIELNLLAARKYKSPQTGLVHFCYESKDDRHDTIPILENFCYALALLRSRLVENIQEAKELLERLFLFEVNGNFPIYLHEYPKCRRRTLGIDLIPIFHWISTEFSSVLGAELTATLIVVLDRILSFADQAHTQKPLPALFLLKFKSYCKPHWVELSIPTSAEGWGEVLIAYQLAKSKGADKQEWLQSAIEQWHVSLQTPFLLYSQEGFEPKSTLFDLFMGHYFGSDSKRALLSQRIHLLAALIHPFMETLPRRQEEQQEVPAQSLSLPYTQFWGTSDQLHTLCFDPKKSELYIENKSLNLTLPQEVPLEGEESIESSFYLNFHPDHQILVNGKKSTTFQLGDCVQITSSGAQGEILFHLKVEVENGEGRFFGHLLRSNRPQQRRLSGFEAYDWQIALRTLSRSKECALRWVIQSESFRD